MKEVVKKYLLTIIKYAFAVLLTLFTLRTSKNFLHVLVSLVELLAIFALSDVLVKKSKWFNILNGILMLVYNAEQIMLLFGSSYITLVMLQSLTSVEDLAGKVVVYGIGVVLVIGCSVLPVKHIDEFKKITLFAFPVLVIADILLIAFTTKAMSPYAGAKDLYAQWTQYNEMKKMVEEYKAQYAAATENGDGHKAMVGEDSAGFKSVIGYEEETTDNNISTSSNEGNTDDIVADNGSDDSKNDGQDANNGGSQDVSGNDLAASNNAADNNSSNNEGDKEQASTQTTNQNQTQSTTSKLDPRLAKMYPVGTPIAHNTLPANTNVIVVFVEGLSLNVINDPRDIMPNLKAFKNESITFTNYFNHTFATYRGIQGQLYSGYSLDDFETNHLPSIMDVLRSKGYSSVCINVEPSNKDFTNYLNAMSFDKVITGSGGEGGAVRSLSDRQAYNLLFETAKEYSTKGKPYFLCLYSFGTHMSFDADENPYGDGSNNFMNRYYNCDVHIGEFIEKFKASGMAKNTLLVITADHSAYADEDFVKTFPDYVRANPACDKIPLYIYYNGITMSLNAQGRNSLDLAPTILDLLGYERPGTFVGYSLYSAKNENTILDSFYWNPDGCYYTGDGYISSPKKDIRDYICSEVIRYISMK